jgi:hypothetical protein
MLKTLKSTLPVLDTRRVQTMQAGSSRTSRWMCLGVAPAEPSSSVEYLSYAGVPMLANGKESNGGSEEG